MIPLDFLLNFSKLCADKPFFLLDSEQQKAFLKQIKEITFSLKAKLTAQNLQHTQAYRIINNMSEAAQGKTLDEAKFADALGQLDSLYGASSKPDVLSKMKQMNVVVEKFRKRAFEQQLFEEKIKNETAGLSPLQIKQHDLKMLQEVGSFYVWEYTLTIQQEMIKANQAGKKALLTTVLQTAAGNLPGLIPLMRSLRDEFAFKLYDKTLRFAVLKTFFDFQAILDGKNLAEIMKGLNQFNIRLLQIALKGGLTKFQAVFYKPYPNDTLNKDIIIQLSK